MIETIGVLGAGQMGAGIAQTAAVAGFEVILGDISLEAAQTGLAGISKQLRRMAEKGKLEQTATDAANSRIRPVASIAEFNGCDLVIEAATEDESLKLKLFQELDTVLDTQALLASNTSSISITRVAAATQRPSQVIGMHFMNPVPIMKLVEVILGSDTSAETHHAVAQVATKMGKTTVCSQDYPGFIVNRILAPMINEAFFALMEGVASAADIDAAMKLGTNQPMGPLKLADFIGLDTMLAILEVMHRGLGDPRYRPCPLLRQLVDAGKFGRKSGRGVYSYE